MSHLMLLAARGQVSIPDFTVTDASVSPTDSFCGFSLQGSLSGAPGAYAKQSGSTSPPGTLTVIGQWVTPGAAAANYEMRVTQVSGTVNVGSGAALNTWTRMNVITSGSFFASRTSNTPGTTTATALLEIRRFSDSIVVATCTVTMNAEVD